MKKVFSGFSIISFIQIINNLLPLLYIPYITRILGPKEYGFTVLLTSVVLYFTIFIAFGLDKLAIRNYVLNPNEKVLNELFNSVLSIQILLTLISIILFLIALNVYEPLRVNPMSSWFAFLTIIGTLMTQNWIFQAKQEMKIVGLTSLLSKVFLCVFIFIFIKNAEDTSKYLFLMSLSVILSGFLSFVLAIKRYDLKVRFIRFSKMKLLINESYIFFYSSLLITFYSSSNILIAGYFCNDLQVGFFAGGMKLISIVIMLINYPLNVVLFPYFGLMISQKNYNNNLKLISLILIVLIIISLIIYLSAAWIINFIYGQEFEDSIIILKSLVLIPVFSALNNFLGLYLLTNLKFETLYTKAITIGIIIGTTMSIILVKKIGIIGLTIGWNLSEILTLISLLLLVYLNKNIWFKVLEILGR